MIGHKLAARLFTSFVPLLALALFANPSMAESDPIQEELKWALSEVKK